MLYIHPTHPVGVEAMTGVLAHAARRVPDGHDAGGRVARVRGRARALPEDHAGRSAISAAPFPTSPNGSIAASTRSATAAPTSSRPPSAYLRRFYFDTVNFDPRALQLAIDFAGADHVLAGSDYPHQIGSIPAMLESIGKLKIPEADRAAILGGNATRLLRL